MMRFSSQYHKRKNYMKKMEVPGFTEARNQLGNELAQVLFDDCPDSLKSEMCLSGKLYGPGPNLWISPSDILIPKVVLTPPLTAKHMKALTHEGILNLGEEFEVQWLAALELEKQMALENLESLMMMLAERDKQRSIEEATAARDKDFQEHLAMLNQEFEELLRIELAKLEETLREYYEALIAEKTSQILGDQEEYINERIDNAISATVQELTAKFMHDLEEQEIELSRIFRARLEGQDERFREELNHQEDVFVTVMKQLKHNLQCNNISCLMYVLCMERRKCLQEQQHIIDATAQRMNELEQENEASRKEIERLQTECNKKEQQLTVRDDCLLGVMTQFQKVINFALRAVPTQAEFLLSVEKMMTFELTQALVRTQFGHRTHLARLIMPWKTVSSETLLQPQSMTLSNYHDCLNEARRPRCPTKECDDALDDLVSVTYRDRLYIREDFRNKVTQGLFQETSSNLWSKEIQDLVSLIKNVEHSETPLIGKSAILVSPAGSSVHFFRESIATPETAGLLAVRDSMYVHKSKYSNGSQYADGDDLFGQPIDRISDGKRTSTGLTLLGLDDSIMLLRDKKMDESKTTEMREPNKTVSRIETEANIDPMAMEVIEAPSIATIKINKVGPRRLTSRSPSRTSNLYQVSEVTIKLNKHTKPGSEENYTLPKSSQISRIKSNYSQIKSKKRHSKMKQGADLHSSKISQHRDSLELISVGVGGNTRKLRNVIMPVDAQDPDYPTQQYVVNAPSETRDFPDVNFKKIAEVFSELYTPEKPWKIYPKKPKQPSTVPLVVPPTNYLKKPNVAKILGTKTDEVNNTTKDFTIHRIHSLLDVLKKDDSLIRMFTRCGQ